MAKLAAVLNPWVWSTAWKIGVPHSVANPTIFLTEPLNYGAISNTYSNISAGLYENSTLPGDRPFVVTHDRHAAVFVPANVSGLYNGPQDKISDQIMTILDQAGRISFDGYSNYTQCASNVTSNCFHGGVWRVNTLLSEPSKDVCTRLLEMDMRSSLPVFEMTNAHYLGELRWAQMLLALGKPFDCRFPDDVLTARIVTAIDADKDADERERVEMRVDCARILAEDGDAADDLELALALISEGIADDLEEAYGMTVEQIAHNAEAINHPEAKQIREAATLVHMGYADDIVEALQMDRDDEQDAKDSFEDRHWMTEKEWAANDVHGEQKWATSLRGG